MALSYSGWTTHKQCPQKYKFSYVLKLPRDFSHPAAQRGTDIHNSIDKYVLGEADRLHPEIPVNYAQWLHGLRQYEPMPEMKFAVDENWKLTDWEDKAAKWRGLMDLKLTPQPQDSEVRVYEWKTGKIYDDHAYQSELYGTIALGLHPEKSSAIVSNVYFDQGKKHDREYRQVDLDGLRMLWDRRHKDVTNDDIYPANPGFYCRWCDFSKAKGGPCQF